MLLHVAASSLRIGLGSVGLHCCWCVIALVTQGVDFLCHVHFVEVKQNKETRKHLVRQGQPPCVVLWVLTSLPRTTIGFQCHWRISPRRYKKLCFLLIRANE